MKTKERIYGKITVETPRKCGHTVTYYILHSEDEVNGNSADMYGLKMEEFRKNGDRPKVKSITNISPSLDEVERLADLMLSEFVSFTLFEDAIKDNVSCKS